MTERTRALMQGNEAVVEGAIAAGMRFFAGYPITPSTEIAEGIEKRRVISLAVSISGLIIIEIPSFSLIKPRSVR